MALIVKGHGKGPARITELGNLPVGRREVTGLDRLQYPVVSGGRDATLGRAITTHLSPTCPSGPVDALRTFTPSRSLFAHTEEQRLCREGWAVSNRQDIKQAGQFTAVREVEAAEDERALRQLASFTL